MAVWSLHDRDFCPDAVEPHAAIDPPALDRPLALQRPMVSGRRPLIRHRRSASRSPAETVGYRADSTPPVAVLLVPLRSRWVSIFSRKRPYGLMCDQNSGVRALRS